MPKNNLGLKLCFSNPKKKVSKGFIDPLSLFSIGFLVISLFVGVFAVSKSDLKFDIRNKAAGDPEYGGPIIVTPRPTTVPTSRPTTVPTSRPTTVPTSRPTTVPTSRPSIYSNPQSIGCSACNCSGIASCPYGSQVKCTPPSSCNKPTVKVGDLYSVPTVKPIPTSVSELQLPSGCSACSCFGISTCPGNRTISCKPPDSCNVSTGKASVSEATTKLDNCICNCDGKCIFGGGKCTPPS